MYENNFGVIDLILFIGSLLVAICVGVYHGYQDRKKQNLENFYFGGKQLSPVLLGTSMAVTYISAIAFISNPVMIYQQGTKILWALASCMLSAIPCAMFVIPLIFRLRLSNIFEYLEKRYNSAVKKLCVYVYIFQQVSWMSIGIQMTGSALSLVTPISINWSIAITVIICCIYTTLGGLRAIVWVDGIQSLIMLAGGLTLFIYATIQVGGFSSSVKALDEAGLNNIFNFNIDLRETYTFYSYVFGVSFAYIYYLCLNQSMTQRLQSCRNRADAKKTLMVFVFLSTALYGLGFITGFPMFSFYKGCDPIKSGEVEFRDQMVPLMVMKLFKNLPGFSGLFVSSIYSGMLSTVSSGTNSVAMTILEVFVRPNLKDMSDEKGIKISRALSVVLSIIIMILAIMVRKLGKVAYSMLIIINSTLNAPVSAIFLAGVMFPWITKKGGFLGLSVGIIFNAWVTIGQKTWGKTHKDNIFEGSIENCTIIKNTTILFNSTDYNTNEEERPFLADTLYQIPIPYLGFFGFFLTMICALIFSFIIGHQKAKDADSSLFLPILSSKKFPLCVRKFFMFGVSDYAKPPEEELKPIKQ